MYAYSIVCLCAVFIKGARRVSVYVFIFYSCTSLTLCQAAPCQKYIIGWNHKSDAEISLIAPVVFSR